MGFTEVGDHWVPGCTPALTGRCFDSYSCSLLMPTEGPSIMVDSTQLFSREIKFALNP